MTRVDFYLLPGPGTAAATVALLCDKAVGAGHRVYVRSPEPALAAAVDDALWTQRQGSFLSHERWTGEPMDPPEPAILIGAMEPPDSHRAILVNLGSDIPPWFSTADRVLEVVPGEEEARQASRQRFVWYRERGYALSTFEQSPEGGWKKR